MTTATPIDILLIREPSPVPVQVPIVELPEANLVSLNNATLFLYSMPTKISGNIVIDTRAPCGVAGSQSCNIVIESEETQSVQMHEDTALCGVAGSQSCNIVQNVGDVTLCGVAGSQSCNIVSPSP
ncbi:hypothetical protein Clacol_002117 [Clathrus columnatus]|uniref:Uncharacterized protein n=1 Tax=Clathrus columnatus TaxID=1419009 RepID=A0AAV5A5P3_9AGAM|nr:hypothetical protein Clacol_002117 [Clathrus columnatus]